jgi:hypothetical protein
MLAGTVSAGAMAEGLKIEPGLWEITYNNPMLGQRVLEQCMTDDEIDPRTMMRDGDNCTIKDQKIEGNTLDYIMNCGPEAGDAHMVMTVDGDRADAEMTMEVDFGGGQKQSFKMTWESRRLGPC